MRLYKNLKVGEIVVGMMEGVGEIVVRMIEDKMRRRKWEAFDRSNKIIEICGMI